MSSWTRVAQGLPAQRSDREKLAIECWLKNRASVRRAEAEAAERRRLRELPGKQDKQIAKYQAMQRDPFAQRIRAEAARQDARRQAALTRQAARIEAERAAEERAKQTLQAEYGRRGAMPEAERRALEILRSEHGWK